MLTTKVPVPEQRPAQIPARLCPEPRSCVTLCTHGRPQIGPKDLISSVVPKSEPPIPQTYARTPCRYVPRVPQEIIDMIVDNFEDMASFQACSLVCWAFVPACRKHIFRDVCLPMLSDAPERLHEVLLRCPEIASYVRDLTVHRSHEPKVWMRPGSPLPAVLSMLPLINRFSVFGCWGDWWDVPVPLASAIMGVMTLGTMDRLHVLTVANVPAAFLQRALSLRILSLFYVSLDPAKIPRKLDPSQGRLGEGSPEYLNLSLDSKVGKILEYARASGSKYFSNIRRLAVNPIPNSVNSERNFARILSAVENTLERLDLQWHELHVEQFDASGYDCSRLRHLRTVQLHIILEQPQVTIPKYLSFYLSRLREYPLLESLTYVLYVPNVAGADIPDAVDAARLLHAMDAEIGDGDVAFPALRELHFKIIPECSPPNVVPDYPAFLLAHLCRTRSRGILSVEQGYRIRGAAVMPLLPYTTVWPKHKK
ncbi:hypothetical protein MVEN_00202300 [Mycena venus]|uniref:Uncharacterized protein n=1 Tax=Mycena venus TaxID=2733690 RepID=A0A8H7DDB2_9AGAR|nr:hypothetical protein MVEN_00202300 [Mycena venus]